MVIGTLLAVALALPGMAMGTTYSNSLPATAPGSATLQGVISAGIALCTNSIGGPIDCSSGSAGGAFFDITAFNAPAGTYPTSVSGTCQVEKVVTVNAGNLEFLCGQDRDLDGSVTNIDTVDDDTGGTGTAGAPCNTPANTATDDFNDNKAAADCGFDDMGWVGFMGPTDTSETIDVCFVRGTDSTISGANSQYDTVTVFLGGSTPGFPISLTDFFVGGAMITLTLDDDGSECPDDDF